MQQWDYLRGYLISNGRFVMVKPRHTEDAKQRSLDELGDEGWELVTVWDGTNDNPWAIFKRPRAAEDKTQ